MLIWWLMIAALERAIATEYLKPKPGRACQQSQVARVADEKDPASYFTCSPKDNKVSVWTRQKCERRGDVFVAKLQKCRSKTVVKRQESLCRSQPNSPVCQQIQCPTSTTSHVAPGAPCDWVSAPLEPYATSPNYFLQCNPSPVSSGCGVWNQMQCSNGTVFSMFVQICVTVTISQASCPLGEIGMFPCGTDNWCPTGAQCRENVCCQSAVAPPPPPQPPIPGGYPAPPTLYPQPQPTTTQAPGGYFTPPPNIYQPQPQPGMPLPGMPQPQPGMPSMPQPQPNLPQPPGPPGSPPLVQPFPQPPSPPGFPQSQVYPGVLPQPVQPGYPQPQIPSPPGYSQPQAIFPQQPQPQPGLFPQTQSQNAFPQSQGQGSYPRPQGQYPQPPPAVYPQQPQSQGFPPGIFPQPIGSAPYPQQQPYYPQQPGWPGSSYPLPPAPGYPQPLTQPPPTLYPLTSNGPDTYSYFSTPRNLPFCAEGQMASTFCKDNYDCPESLFCSNGGCCPLSKCPNGVLAVSHCHDLHDCLPNQFCYNNGCCAVQSCPNGEMPSRTCDDKNPCPSSFTCQSGGCCSSSLPDCPNGDSASMPCSGPGTCPSGQFCHTDKGGYRHGCCDIPKCPNGMPAIQPCGADYSCPNGLQCLNNACCAVPTPAPQTTAVVSTQQPYTTGLIYPSPTQGLVYPPPTLPNPYPTQALVTPARYCFNCCPRLQVAVCFCSSSYNLCPQMTTCGVQGACCATGDALPYYVSAKRPGDRCYADTECPGFDTGSGKCSSGYCICLPGAVSNGFTCVRYGQSPYRRYGKWRRQPNGHGKRIRREIVSNLFSNESSTNTFDDFDDVLIGEDDLIYWKTFGQTNCVTDNECIPEMTCVDGKCEEIVDKLNDNGCIDDEHCNKSIPFSVCRPRLQENSTSTNQRTVNRVCRCDDEHFEFKHKCWSKCPSGTTPQGRKCSMKKSSEKVQGKNKGASNEISQ